MWTAMIWIGLAVPIAVVAFTAISKQLGSAVLFFGVPLAVAGLLAWPATHGLRWALWLLVPISLLSVLVGGVFLFVARAFAGDLTLTADTLAGALLVVGGVVVLIGTTGALRAGNDASDSTKPGAGRA